MKTHSRKESSTGASSVRQQRRAESRGFWVVKCRKCHIAKSAGNSHISVLMMHLPRQILSSLNLHKHWSRKPGTKCHSRGRESRIYRKVLLGKCEKWLYVMSKSHGSIHTKQRLKSLRRWSITLVGKWNSSSVRKQLDPYHVKLNLVSLDRGMNGRGEWRATEKLMTRNYVMVIWRRNSEDIL